MVASLGVVVNRTLRIIAIFPLFALLAVVVWFIFLWACLRAFYEALRR